MTANTTTPTLPTPIIPLPPVGSFAWCHFPLVENDRVPGPVARPVLITGHVPNRNAVEVIFGTSQKIDTIYPTEFVILKSHQDFPQTNLSRSTKFDFSRPKILPFNTDWFAVAPHKPGQPHPTTPQLGSLPMSFYADAKQASSNAKLQKKPKKKVS